MKPLDMGEHISNVKTQVLRMGWEYIRDNFHKFSDSNKIKVSLALSLKDMPTQVEGGLSFNKMPTVKLGDESLEINIGEHPSTANPKSPGETPSDPNKDK